MISVIVFFGTSVLYSFVQVLFNLGYAYQAAKNYQEAYNTYDLIVKKKMFSTGGNEKLLTPVRFTRCILLVYKVLQ